MKKIGIYRISNGYCTRVGEAYDYGEARHRAESLTHETGCEHTIDGMNDRPVISLKRSSGDAIDEQNPQNIIGKNLNPSEGGNKESEDFTEEESEESEYESSSKSGSSGLFNKGCCLLCVKTGAIIFFITTITVIGLIIDNEPSNESITQRIEDKKSQPKIKSPQK
jgi:hypothetical protein